MKKTFIIDTSVLLYHEDSVHAFPDCNLVIPMTVLEELDTFKTRKDSIGNAARYVNRFLDDLRKDGSFREGIALENGQKIFVTSEYTIIDGLNMSKNDNIILGCAKKFSDIEDNVSLLTRDISLRIKADAYGVSAENYRKEKASVVRKNAYTGVTVLEIEDFEVDEFYKEEEISLESIMIDCELYENEFVVLKGYGKKSALGRFYDNKINKLNYITKDGVSGIKPRNKEQTFSMDALMDPNISMITITGKAGSGKTLISVVAAVSQLMDGQYKKLIVTRPNISMSKDIGFLPGDKEEKMGAWVQPIFDNMKIAFSENGMSYIQTMMDRGVIEIESLSYIRGRSLPDTIFIVDEAQNITYHEAKAVLTRMGENSKIILLGDIEQIDAPHLDATSSGLSSIVELFKNFDESAHITLLKGERSRLASYAAKIL